MPKKTKAKLRNYEVLLTAFATVVVIEAKDEEDAINIATNEVSKGDFEIDEMRIERELKTDQELEAAKHHAAEICLP